MIKIYQINLDRDKNQIAWMPYVIIERNCGFDFSLYDEVWSGSEPNGCNSLEDVFNVFNLNRPEDFEGWSLSVSDVVQLIDSPIGENGFYYCDSFGWKKLELVMDSE